MFVNKGYFLTIGNKTDIQWDEVMKKHQRTVGGWIEILVLSVGNLNPEKVSRCNIQ